MGRPTNKQKRQREAKALTESETFQELLSERQEQIRTDWEVAQTVEQREALHAQIVALNDLRDYIHGQAKERS